jgi:hypothetical protein
MSWKAYRLVYRAMAPIHIGWHTLGYIKLTRHYIPGKNMWGAMTANLTRTYGAKGTDGYENFGDLLKKYILASYFYPAIDQNSPLLPHFTEQGLFYGPYAKENFERLFFSSFGQTAILPQSNTAEDESLHESEYIAPAINEEGKCKQVYFVGYLLIMDGASLDDGKNIAWTDEGISIKTAIQELFVGGDMKYGWGCLKLANDSKSEGLQTKVFGYELIPKGKGLCIKIPKYRPLPAHLEIESEIKVKGDIEPLVGREWGTVKDKDGKQITGAGQRISGARACWVPGSVVAEEKILKVGEFGILHKGN